MSNQHKTLKELIKVQNNPELSAAFDRFADTISDYVTFMENILIYDMEIDEASEHCEKVAIIARWLDEVTKW